MNGFGFQIRSAKLVIENLPSDAFMTYLNDTGLNVEHDALKNVYTITGDQDASEYQKLFRTFRLNSNSTLQNNIKFNFLVSGNTTTPMYYSETQHYYEYIPHSNINWDTAVAAASGRTYNGMKGYLVTILSEGENTFVVNKMAKSAWIGASDKDEEGTWRWETGPEIGQQFWDGPDSGHSHTSDLGEATDGMYSNWGESEPNNYRETGEDYAHVFINYPGKVTGEWNDLPISDSKVEGYVVEYGDMDEDDPEDFDETITVNIAGTVTYDGNDSTSGSVPVDNSTYKSGANAIVKGNTGELKKTGHAFAGWNTQNDAGGTHYDQGNSLPITTDVTLYAEWTEINTIIYDSQGGDGTIPNQTGANNSTVVLNNGSGFTMDDYVLDSWDIGSLGGLYMLNGDVVAKAVWAADDDNDGTSNDDEDASGTDPDDSGDKPQTGTIKVVLIDNDGNPVSDYTLVLNSTPKSKITKSNGSAVFAGVSLAQHDLSLRNGDTEIDSYPVTFERTGINATSTDGNSVTTTIASDFLTLSFNIRLAADGNSALIENADYTIRQDSGGSGFITNPKTGEKSRRLLWILALPTIIAVGYFIRRVCYGKKEYNN